jgi:hypothetical protein
MTELCHCGHPLHYTDPEIQMIVEIMVEALGRFVPITVAGRTWCVDRHFIALHGIKAGELPMLGFLELFTCPRCSRISFNPHDLEQRYCGACHEFV